MKTTTDQISNVYAAMQHFRRVVHDLEGINVVADGQPFPYCWKAKTVDWLSDPEYVANFYIFFKRDHYRTFGSAFASLPHEYRTIGQTVTLAALKQAADDPPAYITLVMPAGEIYYLKARMWYQWATTYNTIRQASNSEPQNLEASVPIRLLKRLNP